VTELAQDETELLACLRKGDEDAFRRLVRQMHRPLMKLAMAFVGSPASAEEVVQETWLAVVAQLDRFEGRASLKTWIGSIVVNRSKTRGIREKRTMPFSALGGEEGDGLDPERFSKGGFWRAPPSPWEKGAESALLQKEARAAIERELETLPPAQRTVVTLRDLEGWTSEEVCNVLEVKETHQRVLLHRGRMRLRAALERHLLGTKG